MSLCYSGSLVEWFPGRAPQLDLNTWLANPHMRPHRSAPRLQAPSRRRLTLVAVCLAATLVSVLLQGSRPALAPEADGIGPVAFLRNLIRPALQPPSAPDALLAEARRHRINGAYEEAAARYRQALDRGAAPPERVALLAAEASLAGRDYRGALEMAAAALQRNSDLTDAHLVEADAFAALGQVQRAIEALEAGQRAGPLAGYAAFREGEVRSDVGDEAGARAAYARALALPIARLWQATAAHRLGLGYLGAGEPDTAVMWLQRAADVADTVERADPPTWFDRELVAIRREARRPPIVLNLGRAQRAAGLNAAAAATFAELVTTYPTSSEAGDALERLEVMGAEGRLSDYWRGRALLAAGRPRNAIAAFQSFIDRGPADYEVAAATYYMALANGEIGDVAQQRRGLETVGYRHAESVLAPEALARLARMLESAGATAEAIEAHAHVARMYPGSEQGVQSLLRAATLYQSKGDVGGAQATWKRLAESPPTSRARAQALFWLGRSLLQTGDRTGGLAALTEAADTAPRIYEGIRARDLAVGGLGAEPYERLRVTTLSVARDAQDDATCTEWITGWAGSAESSAAAPILDRIRRLAAAGLHGPALAEALDAASDLADRPGALHAVSRDLGRQALFPGSIHAANRLAAASPARSMDDAPGCLRRLAYPLAFDDLVRTYAAQYGLDPHVLLALLRQESWFDPRAQSGAPAYGLAQVTIPTAGDIARGLGRGSVTSEDLLRPQVSVAFGAWYLAQQVRGMNDRVMLALAAYNAGPGSALRWAGGNRRMDPEDFLSAIAFSETRAYVRSVYEIYSRYRELYGE